MSQIANYLAHTRARWGILTNGGQWRLLCRDADRGSYDFYEFDLGRFLGQPVPPANSAESMVRQFAYFLLFFRQASFVPDVAGIRLLDRLRDGSLEYGQEITARLRAVVFDQVLPELGRGFLADRQARGITAETPESIRAMFDGALLLLYRLLFVLSAEARNLLPMEHPAYQRRSLSRFREWLIAALDDPHELFFADERLRHQELSVIWRRVALGRQELNLPRYDGGLFANALPAASYLEENAVADAHLVRAWTHGSVTAPVSGMNSGMITRRSRSGNSERSMKGCSSSASTSPRKMCLPSPAMARSTSSPPRN